MRKFTAACERIATADENTKQALLGVPKEHGGAHQILNGLTLKTAMAPPFTAKDVSTRLINFDPIMFGPSEFINATRFKEALADHCPVLFWTGPVKEFARIPVAGPATLPAPVQVLLSHTNASAPAVLPQTTGHARVSTVNDSVVIERCRFDDGIRIASLDLPPTQCDFLEFDMRVLGGPLVRTIRVGLNQSAASETTVEAEQARLLTEGAWTKHSLIRVGDTRTWQKVRVRLSHFWRWFLQDRIHDLTILPDAADRVEIRNISLVPADSISPSLTVPNTSADGSGIISINKASISLATKYGGTLPARAIEIQISKPNF
ncbi:MAG: hypothetical protein ACRD3W_28870, partial [Terriglobales bacterium]